MVTYFENLNVKLYVLYVLKIYVKFHVNQKLFTIYFYFLYIILNNKNLKFRDLSDDLFIDI